MDNQHKKTNLKNAKQEEEKILIHPEVHKGVYSNVAVLHHTQEEFMIDFLFRSPGQLQMVSRVILSPEHMKRFGKAVENNLKKYEQTYGDTKNIRKRLRSK